VNASSVYFLLLVDFSMPLPLPSFVAASCNHIMVVTAMLFHH
jgi:hypothetical protein